MHVHTYTLAECMGPEQQEQACLCGDTYTYKHTYIHTYIHAQSQNVWGQSNRNRLVFVVSSMAVNDDATRQLIQTCNIGMCARVCVCVYACMYMYKALNDDATRQLIQTCNIGMLSPPSVYVYVYVCICVCRRKERTTECT